MAECGNNKIKLRNAGKDDKLPLSSYAEVVAEIDEFRRTFPHGTYTFKIRNHRVVSAEGNPRLFSKI